MVCPAEQNVSFVDKTKSNEEVKMSLCFQVADVKKPFISLKRIVEKGHQTGFGPEEADNYIWNEESGCKQNLKPNGRGSSLGPKPTLLPCSSLLFTEIDGFSTSVTWKQRLILIPSSSLQN